MKVRNPGLKVPLPKQQCDDRHCPFHGNLTLRGRIFVGDVTRTTTMHKTVVVEWARLTPLRKYERTQKRKTRLKVHNSPCLDVKVGDKVRIIECRPISKTKNFVVIEVLKK